MHKEVSNDVRVELPEHMPAIWRFSLSLSGNPDVADELVQSTCLRALEKAHQYKEQGTLIGWLLTICRSIWLNELRSKAVRRAGSLDSVKPEELIDRAPAVEMNIFASEVFTKIMGLPEAQRSTVELVFVQEFTYSEAAAILDVPIGTVMSRLSTARKALQHLNEVDVESQQERQL
jgi:RNA polymerase sigma-70 factor (ECF subfamily)